MAEHIIQFFLARGKNLTSDMTKITQTGIEQRTDINTILSNVAQKFRQDFVGYLKFFHGITIYYVFIPRSVAEPLSLF
jgi:hypothetical protein